jgi:hypothetical protein
MDTRTWIELKNHLGYEITDSYPFEIRHTKSNGKYQVVKPWFVKSTGYYQLRLGGNKALKLHRIIAAQFIANPENKPEVDHINRDRTDNRLENLRWVSNSDNKRNRTGHLGIKYEYIDTLPEGFELFRDYTMKTGQVRRFENLYVKYNNGEDAEFITDDSDHQYRFLYKHKTRNEVSYSDTTGKQCNISFSRISKTQNRINTTQQGINTTQQGINETQQAINITQQALVEVLNKLTDILAQK